MLMLFFFSGTYFNNLRIRKAFSMKWCWICNVDCETVEDMDLHSHIKEHNKMTMNMVKTINFSLSNALNFDPFNIHIFFIGN